MPLFGQVNSSRCCKCYRPRDLEGLALVASPRVRVLHKYSLHYIMIHMKRKRLEIKWRHAIDN